MAPSTRPRSLGGLLMTVLSIALLTACSGKNTQDGPKLQPQGDSTTATVPVETIISEGDDLPNVALRIMAANTTSGSQQSYPSPGPGVRIFQALAADLVLIQEFQVSSSLDAWVDEVFGDDFDHCIEEVDGLPNGVISRFPILECGEWDDPFMLNRDFSFARIDLPGDKDLWAVSVHLKASSGSSNRQRRKNEGLELVDNILQQVPEEDFLVIGGDFNTQNRNEEVLDVLRQVVEVEPPFPDDGRGEGGTNSSRRKPYDWVLVDADLEPFEVAVEVGSQRFENGLVFDSRIYSQEQLDTHFPPVRQGDSGAPQMQHMAVVRDFLLTGSPSGDDDPGDEDPGDGDPDDDDPGDEDPGASTTSTKDLTGFAIEQSGKTLRLELPTGTSITAGSTLVIGRAATRTEFEDCWNPLPADVTYLSGSEAGSNSDGFPQINGGERFRWVDPDGDVVDPIGLSQVPETPLAKHRAWQRLDTANTSAEVVDNTRQNVDPGSYDGLRHGDGRVVLSEISDAPDFRCEFVELFYDR